MHARSSIKNHQNYLSNNDDHNHNNNHNCNNNSNSNDNNNDNNNDNITSSTLATTSPSITSTSILPTSPSGIDNSIDNSNINYNVRHGLLKVPKFALGSHTSFIALLIDSTSPVTAPDSLAASSSVSVRSLTASRMFLAASSTTGWALAVCKQQSIFEVLYY